MSLEQWVGYCNGVLNTIDDIRVLFQTAETEMKLERQRKDEQTD